MSQRDRSHVDRLCFRSIVSRLGRRVQRLGTIRSEALVFRVLRTRQRIGERPEVIQQKVGKRPSQTESGDRYERQHCGHPYQAGHRAFSSRRHRSNRCGSVNVPEASGGESSRSRNAAQSSHGRSGSTVRRAAAEATKLLVASTGALSFGRLRPAAGQIGVAAIRNMQEGCRSPERHVPRASGHLEPTRCPFPQQPGVECARRLRLPSSSPPLDC